jgi:L-rhamnose mutarotase
MKKPRIFKQDELIPTLQKEANRKNLQIFIFSGEELNRYYETKHNNIAIALLAKNKENAEWNLKSLRRCYMMLPETD